MSGEPSRWVAFLRGVNLGKRQVKMDALKAAMIACGYANIRTIIASGNVIYDSPHPPDAGIESERLSACLSAAFGFTIDVILRTPAQLLRLYASDPFAGIEVTQDTRLYVFFLPAEPPWEEPLPYEFSNGYGRLLRVTGGDLCLVATLSPSLNTPDVMTGFDKDFGKKITMRNWNTVEKIARQLAASS